MTVTCEPGLISFPGGTPSATDVATFLTQHPDFLETHPELFAQLSVPHPQHGNMVSLIERQVLTLRTQLRQRETHLDNLTAHARDNQTIVDQLFDWSAGVLAESANSALPDRVMQQLTRHFDLPNVALRLWRLDPAHIPAGASWAQSLTPSERKAVETLRSPCCSLPDNQLPARWLSVPPQSLALIPLRPLSGSALASPVLSQGALAPSFGLLVLGGDTPERFPADHDTAFLWRLGRLVSAALSRLLPTPDTSATVVSLATLAQAPASADVNV